MALQQEPFFQQPATNDQRSIQSLLDTRGLEFTADRQRIRWSVANKKHPRNWPTSRKIYDTGLVIFLDLFTYSPTSPALKTLLKRLKSIQM